MGDLPLSRGIVPLGLATVASWREAAARKKGTAAPEVGIVAIPGRGPRVWIGAAPIPVGHIPRARGNIPLWAGVVAAEMRIIPKSAGSRPAEVLAPRLRAAEVSERASAPP